MNKQQFHDFLAAADFRQIFLDCGWDNPSSRMPYEVAASGETFKMAEVAQKKEFRVYSCKVVRLPDSSMRRLIDTRLRKASHEYLMVYVLTGEPMHHLWSIPVKSVDRRQLVTIEYTAADQADFLLEKLNAISFGVEETPTIIDVVNKVNAAFLVNKDDVTKKFYQGFKKQHDNFVKCIAGIADAKDREWYSSVMLNRLMFCYFVQKKGFLDLDEMYLQHKLAAVQEKRGKDKFYGTFYRRFLRKLFEDGLNSAVRSETFKMEFGEIPYLNGGMFELHGLEKKYADLDIPDKVFEELFDFFDQWRWHLDTRITGTGRDINPDVLGYIFEQYINDRAQMGAYYTKEDITEYIGRNCIVPFLFQKVLNGKGWPKATDGFLRASGDRYIFPAMRKGVDIPLPEEIEKGVDTSKPDLIRRRADWNKPAGEAFALPTEIWRETVARRQRVTDIRAKIANGEIADIHDFITYNLDIRAFAEDLIRSTGDHLFVRHFYAALRDVTILDPTCGSGAFLFAALNILEPLYEACLDRMEEFHEKNDKLFTDELGEIKAKYRANQKYFIYKNIILRNLYGVDIMHEATEIARLRLFLKMMAVVDVDPSTDNLGLDPLPDIDFNIKCGNTLVGYACEEAVKEGLTPPGTLALFSGEYEKVRVKASDVADCYGNFRRYQLADNLGQEFKEQKKKLRKKLGELNDLLDRTLAKQDYDIDPETLSGNRAFEEWKAKTQPFHWFTEFYSIIVERGGFDVIIGNPPYVEYSKKSRETGLSVADLYAVKGYVTEGCGNLYAYVLERALQISIEHAFVGMIIPISSISNQKFATFLELYLRNTIQWTSSYSNRPGKLFEGVEQRLTISIARKQTNTGHVFYSSSYQHWYVSERQCLFERFGYEENELDSHLRVLCKIGSGIQKSIWKKIIAARRTVLRNMLDQSNEGAYYHNAPTYFVRAMAYKPNSGKGMRESSHYKLLPCKNKKIDLVACVLNSSLFYFFFKIISNCRDFSEKEIYPFPIGLAEEINFAFVGKRLKESYQKCREIKSRDYNGSVVHYEEYYPAKSKPIIDEIDTLLAKHYGFTEEELDFIINYDIKYRMGDELNAD